MATKIYPFQLRQKIGVSVANLATILGCTKSMLSMVEAGQRPLPAKSAQLLYTLEKAIKSAENADFNLFTEPQERKTYLKSQSRLTQAKLATVENELAALMEESKTLVLLLKTAKVWAGTTLPPNSADARLQMEILQRKSLKKWKMVQTEIAKNTVRAEGLRAQLSACKKLLGG
jgi:transcriptional regulator with XRE-family HTH domain